MTQSSEAPPETSTAASAPPMPRAIVALGLVSLLMDVSSEMIHALLPLFLVGGLGASVSAVGLIEGAAEATAAVTKVFSGWLSDAAGKRKPLVVAGYALAAITKPLFALAGGVGLVFGARFLDRVGKGMRGAPRDALIADLAPPQLRGAAFGLRQSLDTVGAFIGPALATFFMFATAGSYRSVFWIATLPALAAVALLVFAVREPDDPPSEGGRRARPPLSRHELAGLDARYFAVLATAGVLTLARFSEAFLVLRAQGAGLPASLAPLLLVSMNVAYAATAYPVGRLADRMSRRTLLALGFVALAASDLVLAFSNTVWLAVAGTLLFGIHLGATQGLFATLIADVAPAAIRGTAFGLFHLVTGIAMLAASLLAGLLWDAFGPATTFLASAAIVLAALPAVLRAGRGNESRA